MLSQNTALWLRQKWIQARRLPKAFVSSAGILNLPITSLPVDDFKDRALWCKLTGINYNMHGWILCRYCATGWFWWISGLRAVTMWSSASFTKSKQTGFPWCLMPIGSIQQSGKLNTPSTVLSKSSVLVASVVNGDRRWQPQQNALKSLNRDFNPLYDVSVIDCTNSSVWCSSG